MRNLRSCHDHSIRHKLLWVLLLAIASAAAQAQHYNKPKVRAITGFVRLERANYAAQIAETLAVLREAKREFEKQGYDVETIRIVTQPLGELVSGQSDAEALAFLKVLDDLRNASASASDCPLTSSPS